MVVPRVRGLKDDDSSFGNGINGLSPHTGRMGKTRIKGGASYGQIY